MIVAGLRNQLLGAIIFAVGFVLTASLHPMRSKISHRAQLTLRKSRALSRSLYPAKKAARSLSYSTSSTSSTSIASADSSTDASTDASTAWESGISPSASSDQLDSADAARGSAPRAGDDDTTFYFEDADLEADFRDVAYDDLIATVSPREANAEFKLGGAGQEGGQEGGRADRALRNIYYGLRHGQSESNVEGVISSCPVKGSQVHVRCRYVVDI
jgi:hypothetical protein